MKRGAGNGWSSRGGDLNPNQCCDRGETFGRLEGPGRVEVMGTSMS